MSDSGSTLGPRRRRARFGSGSELPQTREGAPLPRQVRVKGGRFVAVDLPETSAIGLREVLEDALVCVWERQPPRSVDVLRMFRKAAGSLLEVVTEFAENPVTFSVSDLTPEYLALAETAYAATRTTSATVPVRNVAGRLHMILEEAAQTHPLATDVREALDGFTGSFAGTPTRDYSSVPTEPLADDARRAVTSYAVDQINGYLASRQTLTSATGDLAAVLQWLAENGPTARPDLPTHISVALRRANCSIVEATRLLFPDQSDLFPFLVMLMLKTGLEPESAKTLQRSCVHNNSGGYADIEYFKARARSRAHQTIRVPANGHMNAIWLIEAVLDVTALAATFLPADSLWLTYSPRGVATTTRAATTNGLLQVAQFGQGNSQYGILGRFTRAACERAGIPPFDLDLRTLRKTNKQDLYLAVKGRFPEAAVNHGTDIAGNHYHQVEANRELHLETVEQGLTAGLAAATELPTVIVGDARNPNELPVPGELSELVMAGNLSLFTNDCLDFHHSPFGDAGDNCPVPFWGCLGCGNAVIREAHLPSVFRFLDHAAAQRDLLPTESWTILFGRKAQNINDHVLPRFSDSQLAAARTKANLGQASVFLPAMPAIPENLT